ncbi:MAG TPA: hypothetical protein VHE81_21315 [Lacipirellulaceae bacterium]|nr:hypothetical protein [Lacipirellulaceae bacterium]
MQRKEEIGMHTLRMIVYPFGLAVAACSIAQLVGMALFGPQVEQWTEWQSRATSFAGVLAGFVGAVVGLYIAVRAERRTAKQ